MSLRRGRGIADFAHIGKFLTTIIARCVDSLPSWAFLRDIEALPKDDDNKKLKGSGGALAECPRTAKLIISDQHLLARRLGFASKNHSLLRLSIWNALLRSLMYLNYRSLPYSSPLWKIIIGKEKPATVRVDVEAQRSCCDGSGGISKIHRYVNTIPNAEKR